MEEEVRHLLAASAAQGGPAVPVTASPAPIDGHPAAGRQVLLVIGGGIAAYKSLDLIRRLRERGIGIRVVMTAAAQQFVTPMAAGAISGGQVFTDLWDRAAEHDIGHVRLARETDLIVLAPATADLMARMAHGLGNDLAAAILLAADCPVLVAPAMNPKMWSNRATQRNVAQLRADGVHFIGPNSGEMAESGEAGQGRMAEPMEIVAAVGRLFERRPGPLAGRKAIVTSGPTHEPIDPVRYIANRSSGKQGHAIAAALAEAGAEVVLVSGPVTIPDPNGMRVIHVETAREMQAAVEAELPADLAVMVAAVADWRTVDAAAKKMKKEPGKGSPPLMLTENPDILKGVGHHARRPALVIGFAAETERVTENARAKLERKGADWIVANDVSPATGIMGGDRNAVRLLTRDGIEDWPDLPKGEVAARLVARIGQWFTGNPAGA